MATNSNGKSPAKSTRPRTKKTTGGSAAAAEMAPEKPKARKSAPAAQAVAEVPAAQPVVVAHTVVNTGEAIRLRAYELFEERGCQHGHDVEDWLRAEYEVKNRTR